MKSYDVVVVGGGAVGASIALALGQCNQRVLLIEKNPLSTVCLEDVMNAKTFALSYASAKIYSALGVWSNIQTVSPIESVQVTMQGQFGSSRLSHKKQKTPALGYVVGVNILEEALNRQLKKCHTVDIYHESTLLESRLLLDHWYLRVQFGEKIEEMRAQLLIAADGANSCLRDAHYIDCEEKEYGHYGIMVNLKLPAMPEKVAVERFLKKGAIALLPWQKQWVTCVWTMEENQAKELSQCDDDTFMSHCQQALGYQFGTITAISKRYSFPLKMKLAKAQSAARFLLMGNAAHSLHPIAAQGLNLSLRDIWQLRNQLIHRFSQTIDIGSPEFISHYICARKNDQNRIVFATDKIARFMASDRLSEKWRAMGITLFDSFAPIKNQFTRYSMGL